MRGSSFRLLAVGLVTVMLVGTMSSAVYSKSKNTDAIAEELNYVTDEFRVSDVLLDDDSELADVMKYARNNKNEYLIIKKESASTSAFKNNIKEIVGEANMLAGNLLYKGRKKVEKYNKAVEKAAQKSGKIVYVDESDKELKKLLGSKSAAQKEVHSELDKLYEKQEKVRNKVWENHNKDKADKLKEESISAAATASVVQIQDVLTEQLNVGQENSKTTNDGALDIDQVISIPTTTPDVSPTMAEATGEEEVISTPSFEISEGSTAVPTSTYVAESEETTDEEESFDGPIIALVKAGKNKREELEKLDSVELMMPNSYITWYEATPETNATTTTTVTTQESPAIMENTAESANLSADNLMPWGAMAVHADYAVDNGVTGAGIRIGIIDTGIKDHPDMRVSGGYNFVDDSLNWEDVQGHGTKVAGIIHAQLDEVGLAGVAPGSELYALKVADGFGRGTVSEVIEAIMWAVENNIDVLNMSFGVSEDIEALHEVIKYAHGQGVVMVAAVANDGSFSYPAAYDEVIAVGSMDNQYNAVVDNYDSEGTVKAQYVAPGVNIYTTDNSNSYTYVSGTSFAAAHVTGVIASVWSKDNSKSANFVRELAKQSCKEITTKDTNIEFGMPDLKLALEQYSSFEVGYDESNDQVGEWEKPDIDYSDVDISNTEIRLYSDVYQSSNLFNVKNDDKKWRDKEEESSDYRVNILPESTPIPLPTSVVTEIKKNGAKGIRLKLSNILMKYHDTLTIVTNQNNVIYRETSLIPQYTTALKTNSNSMIIAYFVNETQSADNGFTISGVEYIPDDIPTEPDALNIESTDTGYKLEWEGSEDDDAVTYKVYVYYRTQSKATKQLKLYDGTSAGITDLNNGKFSLEINTSDLGTTDNPLCGVAEIYVEAIDVYGNNSYSEVEYLNTGKDANGANFGLLGFNFTPDTSAPFVEGTSVGISGAVADAETLKISLGDEVLVKRYIKDAYKSNFSGTENFSFNYKLREATTAQTLKIEMGVNGKRNTTNVSFPAVSAATPAPTPSMPALTDVQKYNLGSVSQIEQFGNFSISRTDVENLYPGSEISISRTYNSMNTESSSFGLGWTLGVENSIKEETTSEGTIATVSYGDGSKEKFTYSSENDEYSSSLSRVKMYAVDESIEMLSEAGQTYSIKRKLVYPDGSESYYIEKGNGEYVLAVEKDTFGNQVQYVYDADYKVVSVIGHTGKQFTLQYSSTTGLLESIEDSNGKLYQYRYDSSNRLVKIITPEGRTVYYDYTDNSLLKSETVNDDDEMDDVEWRKNFKVSYKTNGKVDTYTDEYNKVSSYAYNQSREGKDGWTKVTSMFYSHGINSYYGSTEDEANTYEWYLFQQSNLCEINTVISSVDNIYNENINNTQTSSATYNDYGEVLTETDKFGMTTTYLYDSNGNVIQISYPNGLKRYYKYNSANNVIFEGTFDVDNGIPVMPTADANGDYSNEDLMAISEVEATWYIYDNSGKYLLRSADYIDGIAPFTANTSTNSSDFSITEYEYYRPDTSDESLRVAGLYGVPYKVIGYTTNSGGTTVSETTCTYSGNTWITKSGEEETTEAYDNMGNVISTESSDGTIQRNEYDSDGNCVRTINYNVITEIIDNEEVRIENQTTINRTVYNLSGNVIFELMGDGYNSTRDCLNNEGSIDLYVYDISDYGVTVDTSEENFKVGSRSANVMSNDRASAGNNSHETVELLHSYSFDSDDGVNQSVYNQNGDEYWNRSYTEGSPNNVNRNFSNYDAFGRVLRTGKGDYKLNEYFYSSFLPMSEEGVADSDDSEQNITVPTEKVKIYTYAGGVANAAPTAEFVAQNSSISYTDYMGNEYKIIQSNKKKNGESAPTKYTITENIMGKTGSVVMAKSRVRDEEETDEHTSIITYDKGGRTIKEQTPITKNNGTMYYITKRYKYDTAGNVLEEKTETQYLGADVTYEIMRYEYDSNGNVIRERQVDESNPDSMSEKIVEYIYDSENRVIRMIRGLTTPLGDRSLTAVDSLGNSSVYKYEYDEQGRLISETDYEGRRTVYSEFDDTNVAKKIEKFTSDGLLYSTTTQTETDKKTTKITSGDSTSEIYSTTESVSGATGYENDSIIKNTVDEGGYIVKNAKKEGLATKKEIVSVYDDENRPVVEIMNEFDSDNTGTQVYRKEYTYNYSGNKTSFKVYLDGATPVYGLQYTYGAYGVASITEMHNGTANTSAYETYDYNGEGLLTTKTNDLFETRYTYNLAGMVTNQHTIKPVIGNSPITASYNNYNNDGKVRESGDSFLNTYITYEYNSFGELTKEKENYVSHGVIEYEHDEKYNLRYRKEYNENDTQYTSTSYDSLTNGDQMTDIESEEFVDSSTSPVTTEYDNTFDAMGNEVTCGLMTSAGNITYDLESKMKSSASGLLTYNYAPNGMLFRRIGKADKGDGSYVYFDDTKYIYNENGQLILEVYSSTDMKKYVRSADGQISKTIDENNEVINYFAYNTHGDVCRITDSTGVVTGTYIYDAYGKMKSRTGDDAAINLMRYCGEYYDQYSGCYYLRARFYNPVTMRFKQADTYLGDVGDPASRNLYAYCGNDPVNYNDPTGHWGVKIHLMSTVSMALKIGFSDYDAQLISQSNVFADNEKFRFATKNMFFTFSYFGFSYVNGRYIGTMLSKSISINNAWFYNNKGNKKDKMSLHWNNFSNALLNKGKALSNKKNYNRDLMLIYFGMGLHSLQDSFAHDWVYNHPTWSDNILYDSDGKQPYDKLSAKQKKKIKNKRQYNIMHNTRLEKTFNKGYDYLAKCYKFLYNINPKSNKKKVVNAILEELI